jgi:hypothetical protein
VSWSTDAPERAAELEGGALDLLANFRVEPATLAALDVLVARRRIGFARVIGAGGAR